MKFSGPHDSASDAMMHSLEPGWLIGGGRYTLIRLLNRAGVDVVWLAKDEQLKERVALKFLPPEIRLNFVALDDLQHRTARARKLAHPNIARIHDLFQTESEAFISMEFVDGANLHDLRQDQVHAVFTWERLQPLARQLCDALDHAHAEGVIHRDIKPANLMLDSKARLKVADFGLATEVADGAAQRLTRSGTLTYMSPQQMDGEGASVTDDIYSLGATLYELLVGEPPFSSGDIPHQIRHRLPPPLSDRLAELGIPNAIPGSANALIMACLAKIPEQRPQSAKAVAEWLDAPLPDKAAPVSSKAGEGGSVGGPASRVVVPDVPLVAPPAAGSPEPEPASQPAEPRRSLRLRIGLAAVVMLLAIAGSGVIGWMWLKRAQNSEMESAPEPAAEAEMPLAEDGSEPVMPAAAPEQSSVRVFPFRAHSDGISGIAVSGDGRLLASGSVDDTIFVCDPDTGALMWTRAAEQRGVRSVSISPDNRLLATAGFDSTVKLWRVENGNAHQTFSGHRAAVSQVTFAPDAQCLASADDQGNIALWNCENGRPIKGWRGHGSNVRALAFSADGGWLASGGNDHRIRLWTVPEVRPGPVLSEHQGNIHGIAFSPDGKWMASTSYDKSLRIWNTRDWTIAWTVQYTSSANRMTPVAFSADSQFIAAGKPAALVTVFDVRTASISRARELTARLPEAGEISALEFLPDGSAVAGGDSKGMISVWPFEWKQE